MVYDNLASKNYWLLSVSDRMYANHVFYAPLVLNYVEIPDEDYFLWLIEVALLCWQLILRILKPDLIIFGRTHAAPNSIHKFVYLNFTLKIFSTLKA